MFIIHKNINKTSVQPILKSNSTSFVFYNIFSEIKGKNVIRWGGRPGGMGEPSLFLLGSVITVFTWISKYITWISKQCPHFYAFYWFFVCCFFLFINFSILQPLSWKVTFSSTQKPTPPIVFNLQASDWVHCGEETLRSTFALLPVLQLRGLVWECPGRYFMIGCSFWDVFGAVSCQFWSIAQKCGAQLLTHTLNFWTELSGVLVF